ncbi:hypothetical protein Mal48_46020 [Thalassoglobus polymorphus]|uniref:Uncharacterized protein n=1 Tax=Thalassoglobus polymorphus TaxID=2527994 RepID=A0A517QUL3_9PLAN|nr:hypothetical protein Mal48_46020 [Thalassoglobus polymorphus]
MVPKVFGPVLVKMLFATRQKLQTNSKDALAGLNEKSLDDRSHRGHHCTDKVQSRGGNVWVLFTASFE